MTLDGLYLFNHLRADASCNGTLAIEVREVKDLYAGPTHVDLVFGGDACEGHCLKVEDLANCRAACCNAFAREIIQVILARHRRAQPA